MLIRSRIRAGSLDHQLPGHSSYMLHLAHRSGVKRPRIECCSAFERHSCVVALGCNGSSTRYAA